MNANFYERCYEKLKIVPKGKITTYADLAKAMGTNAPRAVGNAMRNNPHLIVVPCHRVVKSDGTLGGYAGGEDRKVQLLKDEGVEVEKFGVKREKWKVKDFKNKLYQF